MHLLLFVCGQYLFFYSCFKKIIVSFLQLKSLLLFLCVCVCVWQRVCRGYLVRQWVQKRTLAIVQMQAAVRTMTAQKRLRRMRIEVWDGTTQEWFLPLLGQQLFWILLLILFWCIVFGSLELCWSTSLFQGLCADVTSLDKLWCFPVVKKRMYKLGFFSKKVWKFCYQCL